MKNDLLKRVMSLVLVIVIVTSVFAVSLPSAFAAQEDYPVEVGSGEFNEDTSYMPLEYYNMLNFYPGDAANWDQDTSLNPLLGKEKSKTEDGTTLKYEDNVKYGWSNPQLISVVMSAPYWNEVYYGSEMDSAGGTTFSFSTGYGLSNEQSETMNVGITVSGEVEESAAGNGITAGGEVNVESSSISSVVDSKAKTSTFEQSCGVDSDCVLLCIVPLAIYEYKVIEDGKESPVYVQIPLGMSYTTTSLDSYNKVARYINNTCSEQMTEISMDEICKDYTPGDPRSYFNSDKPMPTSFKVLDGRLVPTDEDAEITGVIEKGNSDVSVGPDQANASGTIEFSSEKSDTFTNGNGFSLGASAYAGISLGFDAFGITSTTTIKMQASAETSVMKSVSETNTKGIAASVTYVNVPSDVNKEYGYSASMFVWHPDNSESLTAGSPVCIIGSNVDATTTRPPFLPDDLHVSSTREDSAVLSWSNSDRDRIPDKYHVMMVTQEGDVTVYNKIATVDGTSESYVVESLEQTNVNGTDNPYKFALMSEKSGLTSIVGPVVEVTIDTDGDPIITQQPQDTYFGEDGTAELFVKAEPFNEGGKLSYQWQRLSVNRYGTSFKDISGATSDTLKVDAYDIESTAYRCVISESNNYQTKIVTSDCASISKNGYYVTSYEDLLFFAEKINAQDPDYVGAYYMQTRDITMPEGVSWDVPIGKNYSTPFRGVYDGRGYSVSGLRSSVCGLFGEVEGATLKNINLKDINIEGREVECGGLCHVADHSVITNCTVSGSIYVTSGPEKEPWAVAGICGKAYKGTTIEKCINYSDVKGYAWYSAGICADNNGEVKDCANKGDIFGDYVYADRFTKWPANAAGIAAYNSNTVENCYNIGDITGHSDNGSIVSTGNNANNSYYLDTRVGDSGSTSKTIEQFKSGEVAYLLNNGVTDGTQAWYQNIDNGLTPDDYPHFDKADNNTVYDDIKYTNLKENVLEKDEDGRYIIKTYDDLLKTAKKVKGGEAKFVNGSYILANDIDCTGGIWMLPIGTKDALFKGVFDGNGYKIEDLTMIIKGEGCFGLFGKVDGATIKNFSLSGQVASDRTVNTNFNYGSVIGWSEGETKLSNVHSSVNFGTADNTYKDKVGGLVGHVNSSGFSMDRCTFDGVMIVEDSDVDCLGGLVSYIYADKAATITNCAFKGVISSSHEEADQIGGILGYYRGHDLTMKNCLSVGDINVADGCDSITGAFVGVLRQHKFANNMICNNYYLEGSVPFGNSVAGDDITDGYNGQKAVLSATAASEEQHNSGEVTYLLNEGVSDGTQAWYQNIDFEKPYDDFANLEKTDNNTVYKIFTVDKMYSNTKNSIGDTDCDGVVTIMDATAVQRHCAQYITLVDQYKINGDANRDGVISISDATRIQAYIAGILAIG